MNTSIHPNEIVFENDFIISAYSKVTATSPPNDCYCYGLKEIADFYDLLSSYEFSSFIFSNEPDRSIC